MSTSEGTTSSNGTTSSTSQDHSRRDPAGLLKLDEFGRPGYTSGKEKSPTVVKIDGTQRDDLNGLLGFCMSYNMERARYMVRMAVVDTSTAPNVTVMALKPENLKKAGTFESYKAQLYQIITDPAVRQKISYYYQYGSKKCKPFKVEHVLGGVAVFFALLLYFVGFTGTIMLISATLMLGMILMEDIKQKNGWRVILQHFPGRSRMLLEKQFPFLKGKLNDNVAAGIVVVLLTLTIQSVFFARKSSKSSSGSAAPYPATASMEPPVGTPTSMIPPPPPKDRQELMEKYYYMGYQDSVDGHDKGHTLSKEIQRLLEEDASSQAAASAAAANADPYRYDSVPDIDYGGHSSMPPPSSIGRRPSFASKLFSIRTMSSLFYFYRVANQFGVDPSTGIFSVAQLAANIQHNTPAWQKGLIAFSFFNLVSNLLF